MTMRNTAAWILATGLAATGSAADPSGAALAAPGDCAQPSPELVTPPVFGVRAGVAGSATSHFVPVDAASDVGSLLPLDLTHVSLESGLAALAAEPTRLIDTLGGGGPNLVPDIADLPFPEPSSPTLLPLEPLSDLPLEPLPPLDPVLAPIDAAVGGIL